MHAMTVKELAYNVAYHKEQDRKLAEIAESKAAAAAGSAPPQSEQPAAAAAAGAQ